MKIYREVGTLKLITQCDKEGYVRPVYEIEVDEAELVRHSHWIRDEFGSRCGACGLYAYRDKFDNPWESPYCPICGAKMDEVENDERRSNRDI